MAKRFVWLMSLGVIIICVEMLLYPLLAAIFGKYVLIAIVVLGSLAAAIIIYKTEEK